MTDRQIDCFLAVAEYLSFTQAGEKLFSSQSTISRQINLLEEELGFHLFYRNRKSVRLTPAGLVMLKTFREMSNFYKTQKEVARQMNLGKTGEIKIGMVSSLEINTLWDDIIPRFKEQYPNISLYYECCSFEEICEKLNHRDLDLAFAHAAQHSKSLRFEYDKVFETNMRLVCGKNHPIARRGFFTAEDLQNETVWTKFSVETQEKLLRKLYHHYGVDRWTIKSVPSYNTVLINVRMGNGILFIDPVTRILNENNFCQFDLPKEFSKVSILAMWNKMNLNPSIPLLLKLLSSDEENF